MGTKPKARTPINAGPAVNEPALNELADAAKTLRTIDAETPDVFLLGQVTGRIQTALMTQCIALSVILPQYEILSKSSTWRLLKNSAGRNIASLDEFCQLAFGKSQRRMQQLLENRNLLGQELFEQAEQLGLRQVDYTAIKSLPAPEQEIVRRAVEEADTKEEVVGLIQELASRTAKKIEGLQQQVDDEKSGSEVQADRRQKAETERDDALKKLRGKTPYVRPLDERITPFQVEITERHSLTEKALLADIESVKALEAWWTEEVTAAADYDPEAEAPMPPSVLAVLLHMDDALARLARLLGAAQHALHERFRGDIAAARQYQMQTPDTQGG